MASGIMAIVSAMSFMSVAFLRGSFPASSKSRSVLKSMKSRLFAAICSRTSSSVWLLAKSSGSCPSGSSTTFTFMPSFSTRPMPLRAALMPAPSPSYIMVMLSVNLRISLICSTVREVPLEATTFVMPSWCIESTSRYPSTRIHLSRREISLLAKYNPYRERLFT